jgi:hypothetical protein
MKKSIFTIIFVLLMITFQSYALDFKRTFYAGQMYSNDDLSVEYNNSISSFINNYGFRQIEIKNYKKWYLIDGNIDYALMNFSIFENNYINQNYGTYKDYQDFLKENCHNLREQNLSYAKNFNASSTLKDNTYIYDVKNIFVPCKGEHKILWFQNLPWAEGKEDEGIGEFIEFEIMPADSLLSDRLGYWIINGDITISILNGFVNPMKQKLFYENNRIKKAAIWIDDKRSFEIDFNDYVEFTEFTVPEQTKKVRIEILEVYKGTKYNDTCVTKIDVNYKYHLDPNNEGNKGL